MIIPLDTALYVHIMLAEALHSGGKFADRQEMPFRGTCDRVLTNEDYYSVDEVLEMAFKEELKRN